MKVKPWKQIHGNQFLQKLVVEPVETTVIQISRASMTIFRSRNRFSIVINFGF